MHASASCEAHCFQKHARNTNTKAACLFEIYVYIDSWSGQFTRKSNICLIIGRFSLSSILFPPSALAIPRGFPFFSLHPRRLWCAFAPINFVQSNQTNTHLSKYFCLHYYRWFHYLCSMQYYVSLLNGVIEIFSVAVGKIKCIKCIAMVMIF